MKKKETVGERIKRLRNERGLSQRELAEKGVTYAYISRIEAGTRDPSVKALRKLAARLGVTPGYLETGSEAIQDDPEYKAIVQRMKVLEAERDDALRRVEELRAVLDGR